MVSSLYVIILIQKIQDSLHLFDGFLIGKLYPVLRNHGNVCFHHRNASLLQRLADCREIFRCGDHFVAVLPSLNYSYYLLISLTG